MVLLTARVNEYSPAAYALTTCDLKGCRRVPCSSPIITIRGKIKWSLRFNVITPSLPKFWIIGQSCMFLLASNNFLPTYFRKILSPLLLLLPMQVQHIGCASGRNSPRYMIDLVLSELPTRDEASNHHIDIKQNWCKPSYSTSPPHVRCAALFHRRP